MSDDAVFRRLVAAEVAPGRVRAHVQDPFHHFALTLRHDGRVVTEIAAAAIRVPWTTCPGATAQLAALHGLPLAAETTRLGRGIDASQHCTHLLDLAKFAAARAARGSARRYDMTIVPQPTGDLLTATILRDGEACLSWQIGRDGILAPAAFAGHGLKGRAIWPEGAIADADMLEAAMILRRCLLVQRGAAYLRTADPSHASVFSGMLGSCFTFHPDRIDTADRAVSTFAGRT